MNKNKTILGLLLALVLSSFAATAQDDQFSIAAQYRLRPEFRNGYRTLATDSSMPAFSNGQRARLKFHYNKDKITFHTSIQDSRIWGDEEIRDDKAALQVIELWTEFDLNKGFALKLGRQEFVYDDHRLLGSIEWAHQTISHDAFLLKYDNTDQKFQWHIGGAFNQAKESIFTTNYPLNNYKVLGFTWLKKQFDKKHAVAFIAIADAHESASITSNRLKSTYTIGPFYNYRYKGWLADFAAYYQGGKTMTDLNVNAFMVNAFAEKTFKKFSAGVGFDYISGNSDNTKANETQSFNTLYATNHKFYGYMDYFLNIPNDTKQGGLQDIYVSAAYKMDKEWNATLVVHHFTFANENNLGPVKINQAIGDEVDFILNYSPTSLIKLQGGYSMMFANKNFELVKGGDASAYQGWAFVMITVSPSLFTHNFKH